MPGKAPKQKGNRLEREAVKLLIAAGIQAKRVPLSGSVKGFESDVIITVSGRDFRFECKSRKEFKTLYGWLQGNAGLILKGDYKEPLLVLPLDTALIYFLKRGR